MNTENAVYEKIMQYKDYTSYSSWLSSTFEEFIGYEFAELQV